MCLKRMRRMKSSPELDRELALLNKKVKDAVKERKAWMDAHMADYAEFQVGDNLYDYQTGEFLGIITEHYRYHGDGDQRFYTSMNIEYRYRNPINIHPHIDNTSRQPSRIFTNHPKKDYR